LPAVHASSLGKVKVDPLLFWKELAAEKRKRHTAGSRNQRELNHGLQDYTDNKLVRTVRVLPAIRGKIFAKMSGFAGLQWSAASGNQSDHGDGQWTMGKAQAQRDVRKMESESYL
jgi:hypothetical protein